MAAARKGGTKYDYLLKLLLIGDSGKNPFCERVLFSHTFGFCARGYPCGPSFCLWIFYRVETIANPFTHPPHALPSRRRKILLIASVL